MNKLKTNDSVFIILDFIQTKIIFIIILWK